MQLIPQLQQQLCIQEKILTEAIPAICAAEALEHHLRAAGFSAHAQAHLDEFDCSVMVFVRAEFAPVIHALEHIGVNTTQVYEQDSPILKIRTYAVIVQERVISLVIVPRIEPPDDGANALPISDFEDALEIPEPMAA